MHEQTDTLWRRSRISAGLSQTRAAELLYLSSSQLSKLENGTKVPAPELILQMAQVYHAPELPLRFCAEVCPFHREDLSALHTPQPGENPRDQIEASLKTLQQVGNQLADMLSDGQIDPAEQLRLRELRPVFQQVSREARALLLWAEQFQPEDTSPAIPGFRPSAAGTVYSAARKAAGLRNYKDAAQQLQLDADRLNRIEAGQVLPRPEEVLRMVECYGAPDLKQLYCSGQCPIGLRHRPLTHSEAGIALAMLASLYHLSQLKTDLHHLLADGVITPDEQTVYQTARTRLQTLLYASDSLLTWLQAHEQVQTDTGKS